MFYELCSCLLKLGGHPCPMSYAPVYLSWGDIHVLELCSCLLKLGGHPCSMSYAPVYLSWGDIHVL